MYIKRILSAALATIITGTTLVSCSQPNLENLLPFSEEEKVLNSYTSVIEGSALTLYVDAKAETSGDGSESAPFKTIQEAQAKIRELKANENLPVGGVTVLVKSGQYKLTESLKFTAEDSGTAESPITYVSEEEYGAVLTGGLILSASDFEALNDDEKARLIDETARNMVVKVDLAKYGISIEDISTVGSNSMEIFIDGNRATLSRYPNNDFARTKEVIFVGDVHEAFTDIDFDERGTAYYVEGYDPAIHNRGGIFTVNEEVNEHISKWSSYDDIYAQGYFKWSWSSSTPLIGEFNTEEASVTLASAVTYGVSRGAPFYFLNVYDEIDMPGEFFIDKETGILYIYKTENFESAEIMMSELQANVIEASSISYLNFKGFSLCATRSGGMNVTGNDVVVDNCKIYNVRGGGLSAHGTNITVQNCELFSIGSYGISVGGGNQVELIPSGNLIYNNYVHDYAVIQRTYQSAIEVFGCAATVSHNEICNAPHQAIGWSGPNHIIEYNEVYNVCLETADCGALYTGRDFLTYGSVIRYNYIHDIGWDDVHAHAIYWDDGLSGQTAYGNIIVNTSSYAILAGGGRDNVIENNIIINPGREPIYYDQRTSNAMNDPEAWFTHNEEMANALVANRNDAWIKAFPIYGQIIPWHEGYEGDLNDPLLSGNPANNSIKNNITYFFKGDTNDPNSTSPRYKIDKDVIKFSDVENNFVISDYLADFPHWHNDDYTMKANAKALELCPDFEPISFDKIGRID
ncbi:MAG: right-handed parallel beta-helix repeat-containing protein [Clostridia bacterium]|nr:right-handed parallel beta-helix repeat-containing protein [Clostridia bacterium]